MALIEAINDCNRSAADVRALLGNCPEAVDELAGGSSYSCLHFLAYNNDCKKTGALLDCVSDECCLLRLLGRVSSKGQTFLHVAGNEGSQDFLRLCYTRLRATVAAMINDQDHFGHTAISLASGNDHSDCLELLLTFDNAMESLTRLDKWGRLPIQIAWQHGSTKAFNFLKTYYVDVLADIDLSEGVAEHGLSGEASKHMSSLATELRAALGARRSAAPAAAAPPRERGIFDFAKGGPVASSSSPAPKKVALSKFIEYPVDADAVAAMICDPEQKLDLAGRDMSGMTALHKLCSWNHLSLVKLLLERLPADALNESRNPGQQTALHVAVEMGCLEACQLLAADARVDRQRRDGGGRTPRQLAEELGLRTFADVL